MRTLYLGIAGGLTVIAGGILAWKYRNQLRPANVVTFLNKTKTNVSNGVRSAYGSVAAAADSAIHTERDAQA